ncbi:uncharacterized protein LOC122827101 [Gambusia affinis]|uniref:uncharacterized protein LOC122827101 n=1 Tax=Gambusia affinis TaxID=33528 RepID=UPI001CDC5851|nr:uncharacterized protein LOC122827101 [Gambusia affinis]
MHRSSSIVEAAGDPATQNISSVGTVPADQRAERSSSSGSCQLPTMSVSETPIQIKCALCNEGINVELFSEHLSDFHAEQCCEHCGKKVTGAVGLLHHIEEGHDRPGQTGQTSPSIPDQHPAFKLQHGITATSPQKPAASSQKPVILPGKPALQPQQRLAPVQHPQATPSVAPSVASSSIPHLRPPEVNWVSFLPKQFLQVIKPADQEWIAQCLYNPTGQFKQQFSQNWFHPPRLPKMMNEPPDPLVYFRQRMFLWAPMRMWGIPLKCHQCNTKMHHSGIYTKVREVIDLDSRYYVIGYLSTVQ